MEMCRDNHSVGLQNVQQMQTHFEAGDLLLSSEEYQRESAWALRKNSLRLALDYLLILASKA
jgi:hypothetical protein